jgi:hypothetical protein
MFGVHPTQVGGWKKKAMAGLPDIFGNGRKQMRATTRPARSPPRAETSGFGARCFEQDSEQY